MNTTATKIHLSNFTVPLEQRQAFYDSLVPGDWIEMQYGYDRFDWYVLEKKPHGVMIGKPSWMVSAAELFTRDRLFDGCRLNCDGELYESQTGPPVYLGRGKKKWWWKLLPFRGLICPFTKPVPR